MKLLSDDINSTIGGFKPPEELGTIVNSPQGGISFFLSKLIELLFAVSAVIAVFYFVISAFQLIFSGGDKEAVGKARGRITYAIAGLILLGLVFFLLQILGKILGFQFFNQGFGGAPSGGL